MAKKIGAGINFSDTASEGSVSVDSTTAVTLVAAKSDRFYLEITNPNNQAVWVKFQESATDNLKTPVKIGPNDRWRMPPNDKYTGEVSVIMNSGGAKDIHFLEM